MSPIALRRLERRRRLVLLDSVMELALLGTWTLVGIAWLVKPSVVGPHSPVGTAVDGWGMAWAIGYVIGGPTAITGIVLRRVNLRVAGLVFVTASLLMHGIATVTFSNGDPRTLGYFLCAAACALRASCLTIYTLRSMEGQRRDAAPLD